ncbi:MAG: hypothetical protein ABL894_13070 [Hyphomicrobium sp.]
MRSLLELGRLESLETAASAFSQCIEARNFFDPEAYTAWCRRILVDHPAKRALILPPGTVVDGDLFLDGETDDPTLNLIATILALGNLTITGRIINDSNDTGDFLLVGGNLQTYELIKGAASIVVLGSLTAESCVFCDFCAGALVTGGDVITPLLVSNDHDLTIGGTLSGQLVSSDLGNMREALVGEVFADPDDPEDEWPDGTHMRERLLSGLPLLKQSAV